jgi:hypothetical protein
MTYSDEIIKINDGVFLVKNYAKNRKLWAYFLLLLAIIFLVLTFSFIRDKDYVGLFFGVSMFILFIYAANDVKEIIFNIKEQKISFKYGLFIKKVKEINIGELREISINNSPAVYGGRATKKEGIKYNVDLIDKNLNAYKIYESDDYTDELKTFAKNISEIIKVELIDKNNVGGHMNIYKKRKI